MDGEEGEAHDVGWKGVEHAVDDSKEAILAEQRSISIDNIAFDFCNNFVRSCTKYVFILHFFLFRLQISEHGYILKLSSKQICLSFAILRLLLNKKNKKNIVSHL